MTIFPNSKGDNIPAEDRDDFRSSIGITEAGDALVTAADAAAQRAALDVASPLIVGTNNTFVFEGDSITVDNAAGADSGWPVVLMASPTFSGRGTKYNVATHSENLANITSQYATQVYPHRPVVNGGSGTGTCFLFVMIGANDISSATAATYVTDLESYYQTAKDDGFVVVAMTITPGNYTTKQEWVRQDINSGIRRSQVWDYLVDTSAIFPDHLNTNDFSDGLHPTVSGQVMIARAVERSIITRNRAAGSDPSAARIIAGPLVIGSTGATAPEEILTVKSLRQKNSSNAGIVFESVWEPTADNGYAHQAHITEVIMSGSFGGQYLTASNLLVKLSSAKSITCGAASEAQAVTVSGGGTMYQGVAYFARSPYVGSGPIVDAIGLWIEPQKSSGVTTGYAIKSTGADDISVIAGKLKLGSTSNPAEALDITGNAIATGFIKGATTRLTGYTVATLPASPVEGDTAYVTDATAPTYLGTAVGGGAVKAPVFYNGSAWVTH